MGKMRYPATREPLDLDSFIANFMEDYEQGETVQMGQRWQALSADAGTRIDLWELAMDTMTAAAG
jgi:hypothetical protein